MAAYAALASLMTHAAEDVIESHVVDQILAGSSDLLDLEKEIGGMNSVKEMVMEFRRTMKFKDHDQQSFASSKPPLATTKKDFVVGFDEKLIQIMDRLTGYQPYLQIVPIVGMGELVRLHWPKVFMIIYLLSKVLIFALGSG